VGPITFPFLIGSDKMPRFDELINAIPPEEVMQKLNLIAKITNRSPSFLTRELKEIVCSPDCMIFPRGY